MKQEDRNSSIPLFCSDELMGTSDEGPLLPYVMHPLTLLRIG